MATLRCRITPERVEKQVAVAHNTVQLARTLVQKRDSKMFDLICSIDSLSMSRSAGNDSNGTNASVPNDCSSVSSDWEDFDDDLSFEDLNLERLVFDVESPSGVLEKYLFNE